MNLHRLQQTDSHPQPHHDQVVTEQQDANKESCAQHLIQGEQGMVHHTHANTHTHTIMNTHRQFPQGEHTLPPCQMGPGNDDEPCGHTCKWNDDGAACATNSARCLPQPDTPPSAHRECTWRHIKVKSGKHHCASSTYRIRHMTTNQAGILSYSYGRPIHSR